jgi:uncharacterized protein (TIGR03435 family)
VHSGGRNGHTLFSHWLQVPVVDRTALTGTYDYTLKYSQEGLLGRGMMMEGESQGPSLFTALQEQLGLKLEK